MSFIQLTENMVPKTPPQKTERSIPKNNQAENMKVAKNTKTTMNTQNLRIRRKQGYKESTRTQRQSGSWESVVHDYR